MKKFLHLFMLGIMLGLFFPLAANAADPDQSSTRAEEYDYSTFYLMVGNPNPYSYPIQSVDGSETEFEAKHVPMRNDDLVSMQSMQYGLVLACNGETEITEANPTCRMISIAMGATNYAVSKLFGYYDVNLKFEGQSVTLTFVKVEDIEVDRTKLSFSIQGGYFTMPAEKSDKKLVYKTLPLIGKRNFLFQNTIDGTMYGWLENMPAITNDNPATTVYKDPDEYAVFDFEDGLYDVTLEYNSDFTAANVSFSKAVVPQEIATYSGDLYMFGQISQGVVGAENCKFTCLQPGLYEWKGKVIDSEFRIMGTDEFIPGTSYKPVFGSPMYGQGIPVTANTDYLLQLNGSFIHLPDDMYEIQNPVVTLDLRNLTLNIAGDYVQHVIDLKDLGLITSNYVTTLPTSVTGNEAKYEQIDFTGITGFILNYRNKLSFGNSDPEGSIVSEENLKVTIGAQDPTQTYFVAVNLTDKYDVFVTLNSDQTEATVRFEKYNPSSVRGVIASSENCKIATYQNGVTISNVAEGEEIAVYSAQGLHIGNYKASGAGFNIDLPQRGIYVIRIGATSFKVNI